MYWASIRHRLNPSCLCTFILGQVSQSCLGWSQTCSIVQADLNLKSCLSFLSSLDDKSVLLCLDFSWHHCGECAGGGSAHPTRAGVMLPVLCFSKLYTLFHHSVPYRSSHAKPPRRGELVTAGATSGPALSDPLTGNVGSQLSHLPGFDLNHLIKPFNK